MTTVKRIFFISLALAACCAVAACADPAREPSAALLAPTAETFVMPVPDLDFDWNGDQKPDPASENEEETPVTPPIIILPTAGDNSVYRGTVDSVETAESGEAVYRLTAFPGSGFSKELAVSVSPDTKADFDLAEIQEGDHLEVAFSPEDQKGDGGPLPVLEAARLFPAEMVYYNGVLVELETDGEGSVDLVMVPQGTPPESWGDPMKQFVFHARDAVFFTPAEELPEGALLNIYHKGIATFSIPPQGVALEVRGIG